MVTVSFLVIFLISIIPCTAKAEPKYEPVNIPKCKVDIAKNYCYYSLEEVKQLYQADSELTKYKSLFDLQAQKILLQESIIQKQEKQISLALENTKLFQKRMDELTKKYIDTDELYQKEKAKFRLGNPWLWTAVAVITAGFIGYVIADQVSK